jgi:3-oxoacyl-[acyl-carrier protein] reductase
MKTVIITGASRGIGKAIALRLAKEDFSVVVNYVNNNTEAGKVVQQIKEKNGNAIAVRADISKLSEMEYLFAETSRYYGKIDVV